jgi:hypothetical protein
MLCLQLLVEGRQQHLHMRLVQPDLGQFSRLAWESACTWYLHMKAEGGARARAPAHKVKWKEWGKTACTKCWMHKEL